MLKCWFTWCYVVICILAGCQDNTHPWDGGHCWGRTAQRPLTSDGSREQGAGAVWGLVVAMVAGVAAPHSPVGAGAGVGGLGTVNPHHRGNNQHRQAASCNRDGAVDLEAAVAKEMAKAAMAAAHLPRNRPKTF
jgi:hypothetical protein